MKLKELIREDGTGALQFSDEFIGNGAELFRAWANHQLEGIVSKLASSRYRSGRSRSWLKTKCFIESELTLIGIDRDRRTGATRALLAKADREARTRHDNGLPPLPRSVERLTLTSVG